MRAVNVEIFRVRFACVPMMFTVPAVFPRPKILALGPREISTASVL